MTIPEIVDSVKQNTVIITGGEPTMYNLDSLILGLRKWGFNIHLETSGQYALKGEQVPDWITWSPKENLNWDLPKELLPQINEVKWVVDETLPLEVVLSTVDAFVDQGHEPVHYLMPEGCPPRPAMVKRSLEMIDEFHFLHYSDRLQYRIGVQ